MLLIANNMDVILNLCGGIVHTRKGMMTLSSSAAVTSDVLHFFNDLFDSFNGKQQQGLSSFISDNSGHMQFWQEACKKLINMRFVDKDIKKAPRRNAEKCLANWVWTIKAAKEIWNTLHSIGYESLNLRYMNQDVLENLKNKFLFFLQRISFSDWFLE